MAQSNLPGADLPGADLREVEARTERRTRELLREAEAWFDVGMPRTEVRFDLRGTAAGQARLGRAGSALIRYNPTLLYRHPSEFVAQTVPHEVAHVVAFAGYGFGIRPHGREWRDLMQRFGAQPLRCHAFDVSRLRARSVQRFVYRCACGTHELSSIRHNRARGRGVVYLCRRCRQPLRPAPRTQEEGGAGSNQRGYAGGP